MKREQTKKLCMAGILCEMCIRDRLNMSDRKDEILKKLGERMGMTERFAVLKERSFAKPRDAKKKAFEPQELVKTGQSEEQLDEFVVKPLYTKAQIREFRRQNEVDGAFQVTKDTVHTVEDLEKLLFVWPVSYTHLIQSSWTSTNCPNKNPTTKLKRYCGTKRFCKNIKIKTRSP